MDDAGGVVGVRLSRLFEGGIAAGQLLNIRWWLIFLRPEVGLRGSLTTTH